MKVVERRKLKRKPRRHFGFSFHPLLFESKGLPRRSAAWWIIRRPMASPERQTSHEADPSPPPRPRPPSITQSPADETSAITASLTVRRLRRGSIRHVFSRKPAKEKARNEDGEPDGRDSEAEEDEDESVLRAVVEEGERMKAEMPEAVEVLKGGKKVDLEDEQGGEVRQEFVWDGGCPSQR